MAVRPGIRARSNFMTSAAAAGAQWALTRILEKSSSIFDETITRFGSDGELSGGIC